MPAITTPLSPCIQPATPLHSHPPPPPSDPRVSAIDNFTRTTHSTPNSTLRASLSFQPPSRSFTVAILGASRGIGAGIALSYARAGATTLILAARNTTQLASVAARVRAVNPHCAVCVRACDVANPTSVRALARFVGDEALGGDDSTGGGGGGTTGEGRKKKKALDVLVLNAGYSGHVELEVTGGDAEKDGQWAQAFAVNALGTYHAAHYFVPLLLRGGGAQGGAFCVVGSIAGCIRRGIIANSKYCISKMAQVRIVEHVAEQFGGKGLLAVAVHPGAVETTMAMETAPEEFKKYLVDDPELCGHFLVWLTREPGRFQWLNGRLVSANWDPDELLAKKDEIIAGDLLKFEAKTA
ncbi:Dehydrogenase/reductase SDR family member 1 [Lasiodiplodia hormozganensis]|uniref:Dehydrogenase/reductase SDR family member 1 n=1 Tax=Lasiodiplodia hormozganensis TaxID=869390 RepID=A0AA39TFX0_9PEZI|nr:Dehydrogenase/reductase SDR family member 1 [Lasiodiplodia hormozganensis]